MTQNVCFCTDILPRCPDKCTAQWIFPLHCAQSKKLSQSSKSLIVIVIKHKISCDKYRGPTSQTIVKILQLFYCRLSLLKPYYARVEFESSTTPSRETFKHWYSALLVLEPRLTIVLGVTESDEIQSIFKLENKETIFENLSCYCTCCKLLY